VYKAFDNLPEINETTFFQPFTVFVSLGHFAKKFKKKIQKFNPRKYKIAKLYYKKKYQNI
jgi:hypothetical protein